ncbi:MAG: GNAT family N-acetyltransferase [Steroidobacteraceae bacterium]
MSERAGPAGLLLVPATWAADRDELMSVRRAVFVIEQRIAESEEIDEYDPSCVHVVARLGDRAVGTGRLAPSGKIGRVAVLRDHRGLGIGVAVVRHLVNQATELGLAQVYLHAQADSVGFYERLGFNAEGPIFDEVGIPHRRMRRGIERADGTTPGRDGNAEHPDLARGVSGDRG